LKLTFFFWISENKGRREKVVAKQTQCYVLDFKPVTGLFRVGFFETEIQLHNKKFVAKKSSEYFIDLN